MPAASAKPARPRCRRSSSTAVTRVDRSLRFAMPEHRLHRRRRHALRQRHQLFRVIRAFFADHHRVITGALRLETETPPRGPHQRVEPIAGGHHTGQDLHKPISSLDVFELVHQRAPQLGLVPFARVERQDDHGTGDAEGHRARHGFVLEQFNGLVHAAFGGEARDRIAAARPPAVRCGGSSRASTARQPPESETGWRQPARWRGVLSATPIFCTTRRGMAVADASGDRTDGGTSVTVTMTSPANPETGTSTVIGGTTANSIGSASSAPKPVAITRCRTDARARRGGASPRGPPSGSTWLCEQRQFRRMRQPHRDGGDVVSHHFLRCLRTCSICSRKASSSASLHCSCLSSAVAAWLAEPPKNTRINWLTAFFCAVVREVTGE